MSFVPIDSYLGPNWRSTDTWWTTWSKFTIRKSSSEIRFRRNVISTWQLYVSYINFQCHQWQFSFSSFEILYLMFFNRISWYLNFLSEFAEIITNSVIFVIFRQKNLIHISDRSLSFRKNAVPFFCSDLVVVSKFHLSRDKVVFTFFFLWIFPDAVVSRLFLSCQE